MDFQSARYWAREYIEAALFPGARAIDATMGNGHDTLWLCRLVGEGGRVFAFDVQPAALAATRVRLEQAGLSSGARLLLEGHECMDAFVDAPVDAIVFNLGWLPGGAHEVTTRVETTLLAVERALALLNPGGVLTVCIYPGHAEGDRERNALASLLAQLPPQGYNVLCPKFLNAGPGAPECFVIQRQ